MRIGQPGRACTSVSSGLRWGVWGGLRWGITMLPVCRIQRLAAALRARGAVVLEQTWPQSQHVGHARKHADSYREVLSGMLSTAQVSHELPALDLHGRRCAYVACNCMASACHQTWCSLSLLCGCDACPRLASQAAFDATQQERARRIKASMASEGKGGDSGALQMASAAAGAAVAAAAVVVGIRSKL